MTDTSVCASVGHVQAVSTLRKLRNDLGLRPEVVVARLDPPMSVKTLERWERKGAPTRRDANRDAWLEQLAKTYGVEVDALTNGGRS